jgi:hypothetical protein
MMRLVRNGLMFGNLIEVTSPALIERYNRALKHLSGKQTELKEFHIDISGYSPEIGEELGDILYLNPNGCNRQFILLTTDQKTAPLLNMKFSTSRSIIRDYIEDNEEELFSLTAREAVAGELLNSVFEINKPADLFHINQIEVEADTVQEHVAEATTLQRHISTFMNEGDAWWDDVLIANMIELAKRTGNIQRHPIKLKPKIYDQGNFYANYFGGIYVFRDTEIPTVIARENSPALQDIPVENILTFDDRSKIAEFLIDADLAEPLVDERNDNIAAIIQQKMDFIAIGTAANKGDDLGDLTRQQMRKMTRQYASDMPKEFDGLMQVWRWVSANGAWPEIAANHPSYFYALRASQHHDRSLVNMLIAELSPLDFRQLFICHKDAFYTAYRGWSDAQKDYVARFLLEEYVIDKAGAREDLFGAELTMSEDPEPKKPRIGPWGMVITE